MESGKRLVCVIWSDAFSSKATDVFEAGDVPHGLFPVETYGILLKDDSVGVSIACETYYNDSEKVWEYRGHTFIPRAMVVDVKPVGVSRRRKAAKKVVVAPVPDP